MEQEQIDSQKRIKRVLLLGTFTTYNKPWHDISDTLSILNNEFTFSWIDNSHYIKWYVTFFLFTNEANDKHKRSQNSGLQIYVMTYGY